MAYTAGTKVQLSGVSLYVSSDAASRSGTVTGAYYIYSASEINGRIRITNNADYVGKSPAGTYVTGWVSTSDLPVSAASTATPASSSSSSSAASASTTVISETKPVTKIEPDGNVPGQIGYLGAVVFLVTESQIKTITSFEWSHSASYATHERHLGHASLEFTGLDADTISFKFTLSAYLGTDPMADYITLLGYMREGIAVPMKLGSKLYGFYRWVITNLSYTGQYTDKSGAWTQADVSVTLKGYEKDFGD